LGLLALKLLVRANQTNDFEPAEEQNATLGESRPFKNILKKMKKTLVRLDFFFDSHRQT